MKKQIIKIALLAGLLFIAKGVVSAADVNLTIRDGAIIVFSGAVPLQPAGTINLNDTNGNPHSLNADSVLSLLNDADQLSSGFNISNLQYYDSMGSFYLKCITITSGEKCDDWQYAVNNLYPDVGMDKSILSGGENIYVYFGPQNKIELNFENITTNDILTVTARKYDYKNNAWLTRTGVTIGLTQPDSNNPFSPTEIKTEAVDENGKAIFSSILAGTYNVGIKEDFYFPTKTLNVTNPPPRARGGSVGGSGGLLIPPSQNNPPTIIQNTTPVAPTVTTKPVFDIKKAFEFLIAQQKENGSFGEDLYTDWTALALASGNYQEQTIKLIKYLGESKIENPTLTDYERHSMALMSLGLNPYNTNNENYIEKIITSFDGKQFGDVNEDNDDIFALIVLQNAGYGQNDKMINDDISFVLSKQKGNGSWDESSDMTGASIEALATFKDPLLEFGSHPELAPLAGGGAIQNALTKAKNFLKDNQKDNGSWGNNASSTAWVLEGILALNEKPEEWIKNDPAKDGVKNTPLDYLATIQDTDGGVKNTSMNNKIWETAYVVSALSGKPWNQIMQKFEKPVMPVVIETPKKLVKKPKLENLANKTAIQNTATVINAITPSPIQTKTETPKESWFVKLLYIIFSVF